MMDQTIVTILLCIMQIYLILNSKAFLGPAISIPVWFGHVYQRFHSNWDGKAEKKHTFRGHAFKGGGVTPCTRSSGKYSSVFNYAVNTQESANKQPRNNI